MGSEGKSGLYQAALCKQNNTSASPAVHSWSFVYIKETSSANRFSFRSWPGIKTKRDKSHKTCSSFVQTPDGSAVCACREFSLQEMNQVTKHMDVLNK